MIELDAGSVGLPAACRVCCPENHEDEEYDTTITPTITPLIVNTNRLHQKVSTEQASNLPILTTNCWRTPKNTKMGWNSAGDTTN